MTKCITCKYSEVQNGEQGICRKKPPTVVAGPGPKPGTMQMIPLWPVVALGHDWCGDHDEQLVKIAERGPVAVAALRVAK